MGIYDGNKKPIVLPENEAADHAAKEAAAQWRIDNPDYSPVEPQFDEKGRQTNYFDRSEVVVHDEPTYKITAMSDGTIRKDNRQPPAPKPTPVTVDTKYGYTTEDLARMRGGETLKVQVTDKGMKVTGEKQPGDQPNWFRSPQPREEFGDSFRRP